MDKEITIDQALQLAVKHHQEGNLIQADSIYKKILNKNPNNPDALHLSGLILHQQGKHQEAIELLKKAIYIKPNIAIYHGNLAMAYQSLGNEEDSSIHFNKALEIDPKYDNAHLANYNLGIDLAEKGKFSEAIKHYNKAIELSPNIADSHWNKSLILLLRGEFKNAWANYEYRFKKQNPTDSREFGKSKWKGQHLNNRKILIATEQGFGDSIQFIRYLPLVKEKGGHVIFECKKELISLFNNFPGINQLVEKDNNIPLNVEYDYYIHLMSLPGIFNTTIKAIPNKIPYLKANPSLQKNLSSKFQTDKLKIGIAWAGNPEQENDKNRSATLDIFKPLKKIPNIRLFSLQVGKPSEQLNDPEIIDLSPHIKDFADTATLIENLDLIISIDTSVAHLAGAMGKPTWVLLTKIPDWRWLLNRTDTPWYPTMKLFRQKIKGSWEPVITEICSNIKTIKKIHRKSY